MKPSLPNNETVTFYQADIILVRPLAYDKACYCRMKQILLQQLYGTLLDNQVRYLSSDMVLLWRSTHY